MSEPDQGIARGLLRDATSKMHTRLDAKVAHLDLAQVEDYAALLSAHASALVPLERALREAGIEDLIPDWAEHVRSASLVADLLDLNRHVNVIAVSAFGCEASVYGAAYVLEGSRLGAAAMLKNVRPGFPTRYLRHGLGSRLWPRFLARLEQSASVRQQPNAAASGAIAAFAAFEDAFRQIQPARVLEPAT